MNGLVVTDESYTRYGTLPNPEPTEERARVAACVRGGARRCAEGSWEERGFVAKESATNSPKELTESNRKRVRNC